MRKLDAIFLVAIALTAIVSIGAAHTNPASVDMTEPTEAVSEPTTATTTEATTEPTQIPTETVPPVTDVTEAPETVPPVILYDVPLSEDLQLHIISEAEKHGIDPAIIFAVCFRESSFDPSVIGDNGESFGLMQVQPKWNMELMQELGCQDLLDPFQNVTVGTAILAERLGWYDGDLEKALTAYNRGFYEGTVTQYAKDVLAKAEEITYRKDIAY